MKNNNNDENQGFHRPTVLSPITMSFPVYDVKNETSSSEERKILVASNMMHDNIPREGVNHKDEVRAA